MKIRIMVVSAALAVGLATTVHAGTSDQVYGTWRNPSGTIDVRTAPCGDKLCGEIVRAAPKAVADARKKGVDELVGVQLLQDYRPSGDRWAGRVYVPDMGRTFSSRIEQLDGNRLKISGCLIGAMLCKSQVWTRL
jgi:uncharacterized protein (DUF2147 family)